MSQKTFLIIFISLIIIGLVGFGIYFYFFSDTFGVGGPAGGTGTTEGFSPFGTGGGTTGTGGTTETAGGAGTGGQQAGITLLKLVQNPVAGFLSTTFGSTTIARYMEKETGRVFDIDMSIPAARTRITNTTIPRVHEAIFGESGSSVLLRYLDDNAVIQSYFSKIPHATSTEAIQGGVELKGSYLTENIYDVSSSPSSSQIFTFIKSNNSAVGTVSGLDGGKKSQIFSSPFTEWLSSWTNDKTILLTTKPSSYAAGYVYAMDAKTGTTQKIYGGKNGLLSILSPDGKKLAVSEADGGVPSLKIYTIGNRSLVDTGLRTIADKCAWAGNSTLYCGVPDSITPAQDGYPDVWYQGVISFSDSIWKVDANTLSTDMVLPISKVGRENIDAVKLSLSKTGDYLFFTNKKDSSLWAIKFR